MAQTTQRAFALSLAILFAVTTIGFSVFVVWEMSRQQDTDTVNDLTQQIEEGPKDYMKDFEPLGENRVASLDTTDKVIGDGEEATSDSTVVVEYTGALTSDGSIFDSTDSRAGEPAEFALSDVIAGFRDGIVGMKVGGERRILIPASLGYGEQGGGSIPADSDLVFDVKLLELK